MGRARALRGVVYVIILKLTFRDGVCGYHTIPVPTVSYSSILVPEPLAMMDGWIESSCAVRYSCALCS